jgi:hypothetical protein
LPRYRKVLSMTQSSTQPNTTNAIPGQKPEVKTGAPLTDVEKKAQANKADGNCSTKS